MARQRRHISEKKKKKKAIFSARTVLSHKTAVVRGTWMKTGLCPPKCDAKSCN